MSVEDYGKDVAGVQALQRKQEELERDMTALHTQLVVSGAGHRGLILSCGGHWGSGCNIHSLWWVGIWVNVHNLCGHWGQGVNVCSS